MILTPCISYDSSFSSGAESKPSAYWNPEQPPPSTATRNAFSEGSFSLARSSLTLDAARSLRVTIDSPDVLAGDLRGPGTPHIVPQPADLKRGPLGRRLRRRLCDSGYRVKRRFSGRFCRDRHIRTAGAIVANRCLVNGQRSWSTPRLRR